MIVSEAYNSNATHSVCHEHYDGRKPLPADFASLGPVLDARCTRPCEACQQQRRERLTYVRTLLESLPAELRWDVPRHNQGQIVEVAYADERPLACEACHGSAYQRVTDRSDGSVAYYRRSQG
jgi:hypothetical protein